MDICGTRMKSQQAPGHTHVCGLELHNGDCKCRDPKCRRWFWHAQEALGESA